MCVILYNTCETGHIESGECILVVLCPTCNKCPKCCTKSACRGQTSKLFSNLAGSGCRAKSGSDSKRGLHPPLPDPAKSHKVPHGHKLLCQSLQEQLPIGGITSAYGHKCNRMGSKPNISGVFQPAVFGPKAQQQMETYIRPEQIESLPQGGEIQNGDTRNHQNIPPTRGVGHLNRLQGCLLPYPFGLSTVPLEFTVVAKEVKLMAAHKGIRIHQNLDNWLVRARSHRVCLQHTQDLVNICQELGWMVNLEKSELEPKQIFDFVGYQFNLKVGLV